MKKDQRQSYDGGVLARKGSDGMDLYFRRHDGTAVTCDDLLPLWPTLIPLTYRLWLV